MIKVVPNAHRQGLANKPSAIFGVIVSMAALSACDRPAQDFVDLGKRFSPIKSTQGVELQRSLTDQLSVGHPSKDSLPSTQLDVRGLTVGDQIRVFTDASCTQQVGTAIAAGSTASIALTGLTVSQTYSFYFKVTNSTGLATTCLLGSANYRKVFGITVDTTANVNAADNNSADGVCATAAGQCTLRAAYQQAIATSANEEVIVDVPAGTYSFASSIGLNLSSVKNPITIRGASGTIYDGGSATGIHYLTGAPTQSGSFTIQNIDFRNGSASTGGALNINSYLGSVSNKLTIQNCKFTNNAALNYGGAVYIWISRFVDVIDSEFSGNTLDPNGNYGMALFVNNSQNVSLSGLYVYGHTMNPTFVIGIIGFQYSTNIVSDRLSIVENSSNRVAIYSYDCNGCPIKNSTVASNGGTGFSSSTPSNYATSLQNVTFVDNSLTALNSSGRNAVIDGGTGAVSVTNSIFYLNTGSGTSINLSGTGTRSAVATIASDASHGFSSGVTNMNPGLLALAANGVSGKSMTPMAGGASVDTGDNATCTTYDQVRNSRPRNGGTSLTCDIGAVEYSPP